MAIIQKNSNIYLYIEKMIQQYCKIILIGES